MSYRVTDRTADTAPGYSGPRNVRASGALLHTTSGFNSYGVLSGTSPDGQGVRSVNTLVARDGSRTLIVPYTRVAYHAGRTRWNTPLTIGTDAANVFFLGIEMECLDSQAPTLQQYDSVADQITDWALLLGWRFPFIIYGHYGLALPLGRRSDPVATDWGSLMGFLLTHSRNKRIGGL